MRGGGGAASRGGSSNGNGATPSDGGNSPRGTNNADGLFGIALDATVKDERRPVAIGGRCC